MTTRTFTRGAATLACALVATAAAAAVPPAATAAACTAGLAAAITWDHADPQYMKIVPAVQWQNCKGAIRKVTLETRWIDNHGGLEDARTEYFTADVVHQANGKQGYTARYFVETSWGTSGFESSSGGSRYKSCTQLASGSQTSGMSGVTFYTVARAYDRSGRVILEKISPPVACDQNG